MPRAISLFVAVLGAAFLFTTLVPDDGFAGRKKKRKRYRGCRTITVQSNYTADSVSGCVRRGRRGPEVRLPSGAWIPCNFGCATTLRTQSIDFWHWIGENSRR